MAKRGPKFKADKMTLIAIHLKPNQIAKLAQIRQQQNCTQAAAIRMAVDLLPAMNSEAIRVQS